MKSITTLRAAAFRGLKPRLLDRVIPQQLVEEVKDKYKFREGQVTPEGAGFTFGEFLAGDRNIFIEQFNVNYIGMEATSIGALTRTSTDDADLFIEDLLPWIKNKHGIDIEAASPPAYHSQLEFILEKSLNRKFEQFRPIGEMIANLVEGYGTEKCPLFEISSLSLYFDPTKFKAKPMPLAFAIERRVGAPYDENKYFSQAPLKTEDHKAVLERLEKILVA